MPEACRNPHLMPVLIRESCANPLSECLRTPTEIHRDVEDAAAHGAHEFALRRGIILKVDAAKDVVAGVRQVVLNECYTQPFREDLNFKRLLEVTAMVGMSVSFDEQYVWNGEGGEAEGHGVFVSEGAG